MRGVLICLGFAFFAVGIIGTAFALVLNAYWVLAAVGVLILAAVKVHDERKEAANV